MTLGGILGNRLIKKGLLPWWTAGGLIPRANVVAAYKAIGAASKAISITDLTGNHGSLNENGTVPWDAATGWGVFSDANYFNDTSYSWSTNYTFVARWSGYSDIGSYLRLMSAENAVAEAMSIIPGEGGTGYYANNDRYWTRATLAAGVAIVTPTTCYINGVALGAPTTPSNGVYTGTSWRIGRGYENAHPFNGKIAVVGAYDITLSPAQAAALYTFVAALT